MRPHTGVRLLAPLAAAAIVAVLAIPGALAFVALTAGRADAARDSRFMAASVSGYLESLTAIERHRLLADEFRGAPPPEGQAVLAFDDQLALVSVAGAADVLDGAVGPARDAVRSLRAESGPDANGVHSALVWTERGPHLVVAIRDPSTSLHRVGVRPITEELLQRSIGGPLGLEDVSLHRTAPPRSWGVSQAPLTLADGGQGVIVWRTDDLNTVLLRELLPIMLIAVAILAALGLWLFRRTSRLTHEVLASQARAEHLALHDPLTGLANRALLSNRADLALEQQRRGGGLVAVYVMDLDRFKQVNDTLGHAAGDALIRIAAQRLLQVSRTVDTAARLGGDEFALVAGVSSLEAASGLAERIVQALSGVVDVPGGKAGLSASLGFTLVSDAGIDSAEALRQADLALYRSKADGRGRFVVFEPGMDESLRLRRRTEADLRDAIAAGALEVYYQPQVTTRSRRLQTVEALVRWTHPTRGPISPAYFVPIAEESGLIHALGEFVLRRACVDSRRWPDLTVAVNVSPCQLKAGGFPEKCRKILDETGVQASSIELEITEGVLLEHGPDVAETLRRLREMGCAIALDDFGTGYSSLSYLNVYTVDKIKIDRSFVERIGARQDAEKVIRAIIRLGKALGLTVIAEGVETEAQRAELAASGCGLIQGYLHAAPVPADQIDGIVEQASARKVA